VILPISTIKCKQWFYQYQQLNVNWFYQYQQLNVNVSTLYQLSTCIGFGFTSHSTFQLYINQYQLSTCIGCGFTSHSTFQLYINQYQLSTCIGCGFTSHSTFQLYINQLSTPTVIFLYFLLYCCLCISTLYIPILNCGQIHQYQAYISVSVFIRPYRITLQKSKLTKAVVLNSFPHHL
jgi:hypothetical protein